MPRCCFAVPLVLLLVSIASAQNLPQSDPQAVTFASQSIAALTRGSAISDVGKVPQPHLSCVFEVIDDREFPEGICLSSVQLCS